MGEPWDAALRSRVNAPHADPGDSNVDQGACASQLVELRDRPDTRFHAKEALRYQGQRKRQGLEDGRSRQPLRPNLIFRLTQDAAKPNADRREPEVFREAGCRLQLCWAPRACDTCGSNKKLCENC